MVHQIKSGSKKSELIGPSQTGLSPKSGDFHCAPTGWRRPAEVVTEFVEHSMGNQVVTPLLHYLVTLSPRHSIKWLWLG